MKTAWFFVLVVVIGVGCNMAGKNNEVVSTLQKNNVGVGDTSNYTQVLWLNENLDFGSKKEGDVVEMVFEFKNVGSKPLMFESVRPSCGCTLADYPKSAFAPNEKGKIVVKYNSQNRGKGLIHKSVMVMGNFSSSPKSLYFEGTIK